MWILHIDALKGIVKDWVFTLEQAYRIRVFIVYLFGSQAKGTAHADSDVDIAIELLVKQSIDQDILKLTYEDWKQWETFLTERVGKKVHLELLDKDTPNVRCYVRECSICLYKGSQGGS